MPRNAALDDSCLEWSGYCFHSYPTDPRKWNLLLDLSIVIFSRFTLLYIPPLHFSYYYSSDHKPPMQSRWAGVNARNVQEAFDNQETLPISGERRPWPAAITGLFSSIPHWQEDTPCVAWKPCLGFLRVLTTPLSGIQSHPLIAAPLC